MQIDCGICQLRPWRDEDAQSLVQHANNPAVAANLRDRFPSPYTASDAKIWLATVRCENPPANFAIILQGEAVGGIGVFPGSDVDRVSGEVGYWLGEAVWGRGIASSALGAFVPYCYRVFHLTRLFATPFAHNIASRRVLEKSGFTLDAILRRAAMKHGKVIDYALYSVVLPE